MYERELNNRGNQDAVVTIPSLVEDNEGRVDWFRSRVRRDGMSCLEIEVPRVGPTHADRWILICAQTIASMVLFAGVPLLPILILIYGSSGLWSLVPLLFSIWVLLLIPSAIRSSAFVQTNLTITRDDCCRTERTITWKSFYQIMCLRSHYNDLESGQFDEEVPRETHFARRVGLQAEIETHSTPDGPSIKRIRLGSVRFGHGLDEIELEWLLEKTNLFLQQS